MDNNHEPRHVFEQMDDVLAEALSEEVHSEMEMAINDEESFEREKEILKAFVSKYPSYQQYLDKNYGETPVKIDDFLSELSKLMEIDELPNDALEALHNTTAVHVSIASIESASSLGEDLIPKSEVQAKIIADSRLTEDQKTALLQTADEFLHGEGIDLNNPDEIIAAINEQQAKEDKSRGDRAMWRKLRVLFDNEFAKYPVSPNDPSYRQVSSWTELFLQNQLMPLESHLKVIAEDLKTLGISEDDYLTSLNIIVRKHEGHSD